MTNYINNYTFEPGDTLMVVGHSHGGNIPLIASWNINKAIDNLVTVATPAREYVGNKEKILNWVHLYVKGDQVQMGGGYSQTGRITNSMYGYETGWAGQRFDNGVTRNVPVDINDIDPKWSTGISSGIRRHTGIIEFPSPGVSIWDKYIKPKLH